MAKPIEGVGDHRTGAGASPSTSDLLHAQIKERSASEPAPATERKPIKPQFTRICAILVAVTAVAVLTGWAFDIPLLTSIVAGWASMKPVTAVALFASGVALWLITVELGRSGRIAAVGCAGIAAVLGAASLGEWIFGWRLGMDNLMFESALAGGSEFSGRMAPATAACILPIGAALALISRWGHRPAFDVLLWAAGLVGTAGIVGYLYDVMSLYAALPFVSMAVHTAACVVLLSAGAVVAGSPGPMAAVLTSPTSGGQLARRLLPIGLGVPVLLGWILQIGEDAGWYGPRFTVALLASLTAGVVVSIVWRQALQIDRVDRGRIDAEAASRVSERNYRVLADSIDDYTIGLLDRDGTIIAWAGGAARGEGYRPDGAVGRNVAEFFEAEARERGWPGELLRRAAETGRATDEGWRIRDDGFRFWADTVITALTDEQGRVYGFTKVVHDVSARRYQEELFRTAVRMAPTGVLMVDLEGNIILVNHQIEEITGYREDELLGQPVELLLPSRYRAGHEGDRRRFFSETEARAMGAGRELYALRKDGSEVPVEIGLAPVSRNDRELVLASVIDITERKKADAELRRSNEDLEQFAYVASHDLQEPLRMVAAYTRLLSERYQGKLDAKADQFLGFASEGAVRMQQQLEDLLTYSRVNTRGLPPVAVDLNAAADRALASLLLTTSQAEAEVIRDDLPAVFGDAGQLEHLFLNLIGNALKFRGKERPRIRISAQVRGSEVQCSVADNGIGIDGQYQQRIFVIFQRLHRREEYPGTGIGLAICKKIVERHGGRIWVESATGQGATFHFTLKASAYSE